MAKVTIQFKYNRINTDYTIFNQPLFYIGNFLKYKLLKSVKNQSYFDKIKVIDEDKDNKPKDIYLEIDTYSKHDDKKVNYLLDRLKYTDEIEFMYDGAKLSLKTDKVFNTHAVTINRDEFSIFSTYTITCEEEDFVKYEANIKERNTQRENEVR